MKKCIFCFLLILVSCGGGGGSGSPATAPPPPAPLPPAPPPPPPLPGTFTVVGHEDIQQSGAHISVYGSHVYMAASQFGTGGSPAGVVVWDISNPSIPFITTTVESTGSYVNDVMIRADGKLAAYTDNASVVILDLTDPAAPIEMGRIPLMFSHNLWIEGDFVYAIHELSGSASLTVIDILDPMNPRIVASYSSGVASGHDVHVRDGIAVVSDWVGGGIILDIGGGGAGGSPTNPIELSRYQTPGMLTHSAWYWPAAGYVFVADELDFSGSGNSGSIYIFDVLDLRNPIQVATASVPEWDPHNFWVDEQRDILYVAWYGNGVQAFDVSGTLSGDLALQGRRIAEIKPGTGTAAYSLEGHDDGMIYVSDRNSGLWVLESQF